MPISFLQGKNVKTKYQKGDWFCSKCGSYVCRYVDESEIKKEKCPSCQRIGTLIPAVPSGV